MVTRTRASKHIRLLESRIRPRFPAVALALLSVVLLVLFQITVPLAERSVRVSMPRAQQIRPIAVTATRTLSIELNGTLALDGKTIKPGEMTQLLDQAASQAPRPMLLIRGARGLPYRPIKDVIDKARAAGLSEIRLEVTSSTL